MKRRALRWAALACTLSLPGGAAALASQQGNAQDPVHRIVLPHDEPFLPDLPGHAEFVSHCLICHSPRYVTNQVLLPRKTWKAEVDKMKKVYGAPIPEEKKAAIVNYLVAFHGREDGSK